ncbi:DUF2567 domain-containing protein [Geodermatophilus marinus]|uniref:DUF2567 domain-containing protein n=1 Tax=Geodermatophilus sp. LHW52908 TaxID=2303986 RepID=UPI0013140B0F|nr:DUF2567 domain-containing protein [Geodermatophilus sp. LHW52908]
MTPPPVPVGDGRPGRVPRRARGHGGRRWPGTAELRADRRPALLLATALTLAGVPAGVLWVVLTPQARFDVTADGPVVVGRPSAELLVAADAVFTLLLAGLGLLSGAGAWWWRSRRGVGTLLGLSVGTLLAALVAWQLGELLAPGPTPEQVAEVGGRFTTGLDLASLPALAVGPFAAVLAYVVAALLSPAEDLDRPDPVRPAPSAGGPPPGGVDPVPGRSSAAPSHEPAGG